MKKSPDWFDYRRRRLRAEDGHGMSVTRPWEGMFLHAEQISDQTVLMEVPNRRKEALVFLIV